MKPELVDLCGTARCVAEMLAKRLGPDDAGANLAIDVLYDQLKVVAPREAAKLIRRLRVLRKASAA